MANLSIVAMVTGPLIDLIALGHKSSAPTSKPFADPIAYMATAVVHRHLESGELVGIRACIKHNLESLSWRNFVFGFPISTDRYADGSFNLDGRDLILPNSIIASVIKYRDPLNEHSTGLAPIIYIELRRGIEWACVRSLYESHLESTQGIKLLSME